MAAYSDTTKLNLTQFSLHSRGQAYAITYESLIVQLEDSLGIAELAASLAQIIG